MITIDAAFDAYINANFLLIVVFGFWWCARLVLRSVGLVHSYTTQLRLLNGVFLAVAISPAFVFLISHLFKAGGLAPGFSVNLSDIVVAQYLQGNFEMQPAQLEHFLGLRSRITSDVLGFNSSIGIFIMGFVTLGVVVYAAKFVVSVMALRKIIRESFSWRQFGNVRLLLSDTVTVPFSTRSLTHRYVVIPSGMLAHSRDLRIALGHEFQHMRQYDLEWEIALELLKPIFFWNPAFYFWKRQVEELRELSCDQRVIARKGYDPHDYCACLLRVCQNSLKTGSLFPMAMPRVALVQMDRSLFGRNSKLSLRRRVNSLFDGQIRRCPRPMFFALLIPLLAIVAMSSLAIQKPDDWSQDRIMLSTIVNLERLAEHNGFAGKL